MTTSKYIPIYMREEESDRQLHWIFMRLINPFYNINHDEHCGIISSVPCLTLWISFEDGRISQTVLHRKLNNYDGWNELKGISFKEVLNTRDARRVKDWLKIESIFNKIINDCKCTLSIAFLGVLLLHCLLFFKHLS